jgi:hypothetical protein
MTPLAQTKEQFNMSKFKAGDICRSDKYNWIVGHDIFITGVRDDRNFPEQSYLATIDGEEGRLIEESAMWLVGTTVTAEFRFRNDEGQYSRDSYESFEAALEGFKGHSLKDNEAEIVEIISHGKYAAKIRVEAITE